MTRSLEELTVLARKLDRWMRDEAWPLWWSAGRHENGSFFEALDFSGQAASDPIARVRVQARQIYSFALAWELGWHQDELPEGLSLSLEWFRDICLGPEGIPGVLVDIEAGRMTDPQPNLYVTAFTLLAFAQANQVIGGAKHDTRIALLLDNIDRHLAHEGGDGYRETLPEGPLRLQNPHMHFYESLLCLYETTGAPKIAERADRLLAFVRRTFFDDSAGVVVEEADPASPAPASWYEPGHSLEWVWLLGRRARLFDVPLDPFAVRLYEHYCSSGFPEGETPMRLTVNHEPIDPSCRLWSQTEALKAHLCIAELGPDRLASSAMDRAVACAASIHDQWLNTECRGGFYDQFDAEGRLMSKNIPGSMGYHLYVASIELTRTVTRLMKNEPSAFGEQP